MCVGSSGGASYQMSNNDTEDGTFAFEVGVAPIPQADNNNRKVISQGPSLCILKGGNTTDQQILASWLFVKFLTTNVEFQAEFSMASGYVPVIKSVGENEVYKSFIAQADGGNHISALSAKVCLEQADAYYTSPAFNGSSTARDQVGALLNKCIAMFGDNVASDIDKAFKDAVDKCKYSS
jgi:ABC-type glycerol-3-phosphate transport system substrate-binding protein